MRARRLTVLLLSVSALACAARGTREAENGAETLKDVSGTVTRVGDFGFGLVPDADRGTRYAPDDLPAAFQVDGLRVVFSGTLTEPPANVRLWGTPLRLTSIRRAEPAPAP